MKKLFLILALAAFCFVDAAAQKKIPETINLLPNSARRTEIILPQVKGLNVYKADLHVHSVYSDADLTPEQRIKEAWFDGLDVISITDHVEYRRHEGNMLKFLKGYHNGEVVKPRNYAVTHRAATEEGILADLNIPSELAAKAGKAYGDALLVIPGCEVTRHPQKIGHYNILWTKDNNTIYDADPLQSLRNAREQGAFIIHNHPGWARKTCDITEFEQQAYDEKLIDGIEIMNGVSFYPKIVDRALEKKFTMFACSDTHNLTSLYRNSGYFRTMTLIFAKDNTDKAIRKALEKGMTLGYCAGHIAGDPKLLEEFFKASVSCKFLARGKKGVANYALTNSTSIPYKLRVGKRVLELPAFTTITLTVGKTKEGADKDVVFSVANMWGTGYTNLKITYKASAN